MRYWYAITVFILLIVFAPMTKNLFGDTTPEHLNSVEAATRADLEKQFGAPTRITKNADKNCSVWHYDTFSERPLFIQSDDRAQYTPSSQRSMSFCIASDGRIVERALSGKVYLKVRPALHAESLMHVRTMTAEELQKPGIPPFPGEDAEKVAEYYRKIAG